MPERAFVAAVDFGGTKAAVASATLDGTVIDQPRLKTQAASGAEQEAQISSSSSELGG